MTDLTPEEDAILSEGLCPHCQGELRKVPNVLEWQCQNNADHLFAYVTVGESTAAMLRCTACLHEWFGEYNLEARIAICPICVNEAQPV